MKCNGYAHAIILVIFVLSNTPEVKPQSRAINKCTLLNRSLSAASYKELNINNIITYIYNNGLIDNNPFAPNEGLEFPKGTGKTVIYQSGFLWGGKINGEIRVSGSTYFSGLTPGKILKNGTPENPDNANVRVYRVRRDFKTSDLKSEINAGEGTYRQIYDNYLKDWNEWPGEDGAPYKDVDRDSTYDPSIDIPGVPGADQTIWYVANDLNKDQTQKFAGSLPVGIELQVTVWGYNTDGTLGNTNFRKYRLVNRSGNEIKDMYLAQWSDVDDGGAVDDLAGCDSARSLGFVYNSSGFDSMYGSTPPAVGFDIIQGPVIDGSVIDHAIYDNKIIFGKKNLPMTSFVSFSCGDTVYSMPAFFDYTKGALAWYNFFQGRTGKRGESFKIPPQLGGGATSFLFNGDPLEGTGWIDGVEQLCGDKNILLSTGPFNMAPGDTQEVVIANMVGAGKDELNGVRILRFYDIQVQNAYDKFLNLSVPILPSPKLIASYTGDKIYLSWDASQDSLKVIEEFSKNRFFFEGYNVYQLYSDLPLVENTKLIATFDLNDQLKDIPGEGMNQFSGLPETRVLYAGSDMGLKRNIILNKDFINDEPLIKGKKYYFGIGAYGYNECGCAPSNTSESLSNIVEVNYLSSLPGYNYGDAIKVNHTSGLSDGEVKPVVINPYQLTGHTYNITFNETDSLATWNLVDSTAGKTLLANQEDFSVSGKAPFVDGLQINVKDVYQKEIKEWKVPAGTRRFSWENAYFGFDGFYGAIGWASPYHYYGAGKKEVVPVTQLKNTLIKLARVIDSTSNYYPLLNRNDSNMSYGYRYGALFERPPANPAFEKFMVNKSNGFAYQDFTKSVPLSAWNVDDPLHPIRLAVGFLENNSSAGLVDGEYWPGNSSYFNNVDTSGPREWLFIFNSEYGENPNQEYQKDIIANPIPVMWWLTTTRKGDAPFSPGSSGEDQFLIIPSRAFSPKDIYSFSTEQDTAWRKWNFPDDFELSQNYPNPFNPATKIRFTLKEKGFVKLDVFNLLGQKVIELLNSEMDIGTYEVPFDGSKYASGIYFYRLDVKGKYTSIKKMVFLK